MSFCRYEPTIAEILSDSIVQAVMDADGVDPKRLEALLRSMAQNLAEVRQVSCDVLLVRSTRFRPRSRSNLRQLRRLHEGVA
jgi:hypothetical protein